MLKIAVVAHRAHDQRSQRALHIALGDRFELTRLDVEDGWPQNISDLPHGTEYDAVLFFVRFRELRERPAFDWQTFRGVRVLLDFDINLNYHTLGGSGYLGAWPPVLRRLELDLVLTTGGDVARKLRADGLPARWLPKAFDGEAIYDQGRSRSGLCTYGRDYRSRKAMNVWLRRGRIPVTRFSCPYGELNEHLNGYLGCLICNLGARLQPGFLWKVANKLNPLWGLELAPGLEPMIKNFEAAGAGCAPITDQLDDLEALGFVDGETMVAWRNFDELVQSCRWYLDRPDQLAAIGENACRLAHQRHTWRHRARTLEEYISELRGTHPR